MSHRQRARPSHLPAAVSGLVAILNTLGRALQALGALSDRLSDEHLLRAAQRHTGLSDFGDDAFRTPLRMLVRSYNQVGGLTPFGRALIRRWILNGLVNRLLIAHEIREHPEILDTPIRRPLFIASLPRTGTTLLHKLLTQDPQARPLLAWEALAPARRPADIDRRRDPRISRAQRLARALTVLAPVLRTIHDFDPLGPEECAPLLRNTFLLAAEMSPVYREWFLRQPAAATDAAYREYRQQLQLLQWQRPYDGHWTLKTPLHLYAIGALLTVFPDACIVLTHRDPVRALPSACSLMSVLFDAVMDNPDRHDTLGPRVVSWAAEGLRRAEAARAQAGPGRIYDVRYHELMADPLGEVQRLYAHFGYPYTREFEARAITWLREHPQHKHGEHQYRPEQYGLDRRMIDESFAWYRERHRIPPEP